MEYANRCLALAVLGLTTISTPGSADVSYERIETVNTSLITTVQRLDGTLPTSYRLSQNYPNPFNPTTTITYELPSSGNVQLILFDALGRKVGSLVKARHVAGRYAVSVRADGLASGVYIYILVADGYTASRRMIILK